jgi:hypothetical protein
LHSSYGRGEAPAAGDDLQRVFDLNGMKTVLETAGTEP